MPIARLHYLMVGHSMQYIVHMCLEDIPLG